MAIELDYLHVVKHLKSGERDRSCYSFLVHEIKQLMDERRTWITVVRHTHNLASHIMANFGRVEGRKVVWLSNNIIRIVTLFLSNTSFIPAKNRHVAHFFVPKFEAIVERRPRYTSRTQEDIAVRPKRWMATNS